MNIFDLRDAVVDDYLEYVKGFINISDPDVDQTVRKSVDDGLLSPESIVQLNPSYEQGESIENLVEEGVLHPDCAEIFRFNGAPMKFYKHQTDAIRRAVRGEDYILTTGTGSGKSMTYIVPIVNHILSVGSGKGVQAIIVYPMNALANSQIGELKKFLPENGPFSEKIKFRRYTGQEKTEEKNAIRNDPPDVILTNYMMLELLLTRASEKSLVNAMKNLRFFVLDEIHSYRGRQGADVALLARRTLDAAVGAETDKVVCVGTSATIASGKSREDDRREVARVAEQIFGKSFKSENIVGETLRRETEEFDFNVEKDALRQEVVAFADASDEKSLCAFFDAKTPLDALRRSKLASWIESQFGMERDETTGELARQTPKPISGTNGAAQTLAKLVDLDDTTCARAIKFVFLCGADAKTESDRSFFPFKLHQFVGRGENAYATAELGEKRRVFMAKQVYAPDSDRKAKLFPLVFCANCGQDFYSVERVVSQKPGADVASIRFDAREPFDSLALDLIDKENVGYLLLLKDQSKSQSEVKKDIFESLPDEWKEESKGVCKIIREREKDVPVFYRVNKLGEVVSEDDEEGVNVLFVPSPFRFCPECLVAYPPDTSARTARSDSSHLSNLSVGGRSSATTLLALSTEKRLLKFFADKPEESEERRQENLKKRKFLSFTDNRQDASLQAGHFNDFVKVCVLRAALYKALKNAGDEGLTYENVAEKVVETLNLEIKELDRGGSDNLSSTMKNGVLSSFKKTVRYHIMRDLRRGWRYLVPNLEQTGLLKIEYADVEEIANDEERWKKASSVLRTTSPQKRAEILAAFLDHLRRELVVDAEELQLGVQEKLVSDVKSKIKSQWGFDEAEDYRSLYHAETAYPRTSKELHFKNHEKNENLCVTPRSGFGSYLLRELRKDGGDKIKREDIKPVIDDIFSVCQRAGLINKTDEKNNGYQLVSSCILWKIADERRQPADILRQYGQTKKSARVNDYFRKLYQDETALEARKFYAREHTAQVAPKEREDREKLFRAGLLPILFCSPTMELGVDISELNVVHMRNIPPTPANYAQRSGRAGRSGQPALSLVYATPLNQHDRYYFKRPEKVVAGAVAPPQIDLLNKALLQSHVYAIWLSEAVKGCDFRLGDQMTNLIAAPDFSDDRMRYGDVPKEKRVSVIREEILDVFKNESVRKSAAIRAKRVLKPILEEQRLGSERLNEKWIDEILDDVEKNFREACKRWMTLYDTAFRQYGIQSQNAASQTLSLKDKKLARRLAAQALKELNLLSNDDESYNEKNEFYPYRYFAAEGFLPGYNFPRIPVFAFLPGLNSQKGTDEEYLSRPRFLAISEFGPKAIVYHEGARYRIDRVSIAPSDSDSDGATDPTTSAAVCENCGYFHEVEVDVCENCGGSIKILPNLLELQKVVARRATRITCDEEERMRFGYAISTSYHFAKRDGVAIAVQAEIVLPDGSVWGKLTYAPSATIYRVNNGLNRSNAKEQNGFRLDMTSGFWVSGKEDANDDQHDEEERVDEKNIRFVRPFVRDTKNCVVIEPFEALAPNKFASFQAALQRAIERVFSIDDHELGAFPLPDEDERAQLLLYEAAEGGAGALQRLLEETKFQDVVREAFAVCHYDLEADKDIEEGPNAPNGCEAACYDCLLSYSNQHEHEMIDRNLAIDVLKKFVGATLRVSSNSFQTRDEILELLKSKTESQLERDWLAFVDAHNWRLPTEAQKTFDFTTTRPDFYYKVGGSRLAVYIDGDSHDEPQRKREDEKFRKALRDEYCFDVAVFRYDERDRWSEIVDQYRRFFYLDDERSSDCYESEPTSGASWEGILNEFDGFFGEDAKNFIKAAAKAGIPAPSKDYVGYEVEGDDGEVVASLELAWPDKKIGFLTDNQLEDKEKLEQNGWQIVDINSLDAARGILGD